jgi:general secretion pathway protein D
MAEWQDARPGRRGPRGREGQIHFLNKTSNQRMEGRTMLICKRWTAALAMAALLGPMLPLEAHTHKGDRYLAEGRSHEEKREWDAALECYERALSTDPSEMVYRIAVTKARFQAGAMHQDQGMKIRAQGNLGDALLEFQKALALDPSSAVAGQAIVETQEMIAREREKISETGKESPPSERGLTPLERARNEAEAKMDRILPLPELRQLNPLPHNMTLHGPSAKVLFETIAKVAGINVVWDPDYQNMTKNLNVDLDHTTLEQALDDIALQTKSFWKPLAPNTIFITNDTQAKHHEFDDQVTQTFYLANVNTPQQIQDIINVVRQMTELQHISAFNAQNAIVVRGEADKVALAETLVHDLDKPAPEVQVDILVLETDSVFDRQLSAAIATGGLNVPINFAPRTSIQEASTSSSSSSSTEPIPVANVGHLSSADYSIVLPNALLQATLSDTKTRVLQAPQLRTVDNVKAELKIGQREPTASGSYQPGVAGSTVNPLVNTQFTYIDVGVNVLLTAHVHDNGDISIHIELEISNIAGTVDLGGINEPIIGQRKVTHDVRLREGEVNLIAGLTSTTDNKTVTGIPGLSSIPFLGKLFSGDSVDKERDEIMMAIVPHIIRRPNVTAEELRPIAVGSQATVKLSYAPKEVEPPPAPGGDGKPAPSAPAVSASPSGANLPPATAPAEAAPAQARLVPEQIDTASSGVFTVGLSVDHAEDLQSAQFEVQFDPKIVQLSSVEAGGLLAVDGLQPTLTKNVENESGSARVEILRTPGTAGVRASGLLCTLRFQAVGKGSSTIALPSLVLRNGQGQIIGSASPRATLNVR